MDFNRTIPDEFLKEFADRINYKPEEGQEPDYAKAVSDWINANIDSHLVQIVISRELSKVQSQIDAIHEEVDTKVQETIANI